MPRKPKALPKDPVLKDAAIRLRASHAQKALLEEAARTAGLSLSSWLLWLGLREATAQRAARGGA